MDWNAYHFVGNTLRDGTPVPADGVTLKFDGELKLCKRGFHFSREAWQALDYAPGNTLCRVRVGGTIIDPRSSDKGVCSERTIVSRIDAKGMLIAYARSCALDVIHLWNAPPVVREFLETGNEDLRYAARAATRDAVTTGWVAQSARDAARAAEATWASWDAARAAEATWASWDAARDAARAARYAEMAAAEQKRRARFTTMVNDAFKEPSDHDLLFNSAEVFGDA